MTNTVLSVTDLAVQVGGSNPVTLVSDATFAIEAGSTLGIVGESGSGKSLTALAIMGLLPTGLRVSSGAITLEGEDLTAASADTYRDVRGRRIGMIFQDPQNSLNPAFTIGGQLIETIRCHDDCTKKHARARAIELLERVGIPSPASRLGDYPHQFSGGMAQRVMIALAIACRPTILIADEPTTALDVTVQAQILELLLSLQEETGMTLLIISHDLSVIAQMATEVAVMYAGEVVEHGSVDRVFRSPDHPYTEALLAAQPDAANADGRLIDIPGTVPEPSQRDSGCRFFDRCKHRVDQCHDVHPELVEHDGSMSRCHRTEEVEYQGIQASAHSTTLETASAATGEVLVQVTNLSKQFRLRGSLFGRGSTIHAVKDASFEVAAGETVGVVGESGAGKSTVGRLVLGLEDPSRGTVTIDDVDVHAARGAERRRLRREISVVFQNPYASLDPSMTIEDIVVEPLTAHERLARSERSKTAAELLAEVGLAAHYRRSYPHELSGGQRQRVAIARALAIRPRLVVCDEAVSALDVSTQAQVLNLLADLQAEHKMAYLFVGHDLAVVHHISDRIVVMYRGEIVEIGPADTVYHHARHPYTKALLGAVLSIDPSTNQLAPTVRAVDLPAASTGCPFAHRCPDVMERCHTEIPRLQASGTARVACHLYDEPNATSKG